MVNYKVVCNRITKGTISITKFEEKLNKLAQEGYTVKFSKMAIESPAGCVILYALLEK
jgi:hypothetical protein